jgi:hypothetical protein
MQLSIAFIITVKLKTNIIFKSLSIKNRHELEN